MLFRLMCLLGKHGYIYKGYSAIVNGDTRNQVSHYKCKRCGKMSHELILEGGKKIVF